MGDRNINLQKIADTSLLVTWSKISSDFPCGSVNAEYKIYWKKKDKIASNVITAKGFQQTLSGKSYIF